VVPGASSKSEIGSHPRVALAASSGRRISAGDEALAIITKAQVAIERNHEVGKAGIEIGRANSANTIVAKDCRDREGLVGRFGQC
jgi:hypothetical protein